MPFDIFEIENVADAAMFPLNVCDFFILKSLIYLEYKSLILNVLK